MFRTVPKSGPRIFLEYHSCRLDIHKAKKYLVSNQKISMKLQEISLTIRTYAVETSVFFLDLQSRIISFALLSSPFPLLSLFLYHFLLHSLPYHPSSPPFFIPWSNNKFILYIKVCEASIEAKHLPFFTFYDILSRINLSENKFMKTVIFITNNYIYNSFKLLEYL